MANVTDHSSFIIQVEDDDGDDWHDACLPIMTKEAATKHLRDMKKDHRASKYHLIERTTIVIEHIIS